MKVRTYFGDKVVREAGQGARGRHVRRRIARKVHALCGEVAALAVVVEGVTEAELAIRCGVD